MGRCAGLIDAHRRFMAGFSNASASADLRANFFQLADKFSVGSELAN
jgi:hypothetical protein